MLEHWVEGLLPPVISVLELIGIFVVIHSSLRAFWQYLKVVFAHRSTDFKLELAEGLAAGLDKRRIVLQRRTTIMSTWTGSLRTMSSCR